MASTLKHIEIPIPFKGLDTDSSSSQVSPQHARELHNTIVSPTEIRARNGWVQGEGHYTVVTGTKNSMWPISFTSFTRPGVATPITMAHIAEDATANVWSDGYLAAHRGGVFGGTGIDCVIHTPTTGASAAPGAATLLPTAGPFAYYDGNGYGVGLPTGSESRLVMWCGGWQYAEHAAGGVTINNGALTGTFSTIPANSMQDYILTVTTGATGPLAGYRYSYRIVSHNGGSAAFQIAHPYGLGENATNVPNAVAASSTMSIAAMQTLGFIGATSLANCPMIPGAVAMFRERLFVGRGRASTLAGNYQDQPNKLQWSLPGQPQKFTLANTTFVGEPTEDIMAMASINDVLLIFTKTNTYVLSGYDEDSFTIRLLYSGIGCLNSHSLSTYNGSVIFVDRRGVFATNGQSDPVELSQMTPGVGIRRELEDALLDASSQFPITVPATAVFNDKLVLAIQSRDITVTTPRAAWMYDFKLGSWSRWGNTSSSGRRQPWLFAQVANTTNTVMPWQIVNITECWEKPPLIGLFAGTAEADNAKDADFDTSDNLTSTIIDCTVRYGDIRMGGADTTRVKGMQFEHNCHYYGSSSSPRVAWAVTLDVDNEIDESSSVVDDIDSRYIGNTSAPEFDKYFTDRFQASSFKTEGAVFRIKLVKSATSTSVKLFKTYMLVDGQATLLGRVDNPTL